MSGVSFFFLFPLYSLHFDKKCHIFLSCVNIFFIYSFYICPCNERCKIIVFNIRIFLKTFQCLQFSQLTDDVQKNFHFKRTSYRNVKRISYWKINFLLTDNFELCDLLNQNCYVERKKLKWKKYALNVSYAICPWRYQSI